MKIEFQGKYDKVNLYSAVIIMSIPSRRVNIIRAILLVFLLVIYCMYIIEISRSVSSSRSDVSQTGTELLGVTLPAVILLYLLLQPYIFAYQAAAALWKSPSIQAGFSGFVSSRGITHDSINGPIESTWDAFIKVRKTNNFIALLTADGVLSLLLRSFFDSENDWSMVRQWVDLKVMQAI